MRRSLPGADPRTTMRYDRARKNLDRHPNDILAAYMPPAPEPGDMGSDHLLFRDLTRPATGPPV